MSQMKKYVLLLVALLPCARPVMAQDSASMVGTVTDNSGAAVPGATVELTNPATGKSAKTTTGQNGGYTFTNVGAGPGYKETVSRRWISDDGVKRLVSQRRRHTYAGRQALNRIRVTDCCRVGLVPGPDPQHDRCHDR